MTAGHYARSMPGTYARAVLYLIKYMSAPIEPVAKLQVENEDERTPMAALAFATIEGFVVLDALNQASLITNALHGITLQ